ncbi:MAG: ABC transporter permease [Spirochaetia bacterium]|nr:ABC transporter permease [Spirochaetia bacterium]
MNKVLRELIIVQFREYWRAPEVLFWTLGFPIMIASVLGLLYSFKPAENHRVAYIVQESSENNRQNLDHIKTNDIIKSNQKNFQNLAHFFENLQIDLPGKSIRKISFEKMDRESAEKAYRSGKIEIIVQLQIDGSLQYLYDPANERAENLYLWIDNRIHENSSNVKSQVLKLNQRGSRYIDRLIPGLIALGIMNSTLWGIGWTLIEFRIKKFLRRMIVTPMRKIDFMLSISIVRMGLSVIEAGILFLFARYFFDVRLQGDFLTFAVLFLAGHIAFSGLSILLASRTNNTRVGNGLINIVTMPMFLLSGVFFSYHSFPDWMVSIIQYLPLTILADTMRNVFLYNASFMSIGFSILYLVTFGVILYIAGLKYYRWY